MNYDQIIRDLTKRIEELERNQVGIYMPYDKVEAMRNQIILKKDVIGSETITGFLIFTWKDVQYKVPFYV